MFGGTKVKNKKGKTVTLLNPAQKGKKYSLELKEKYAISNSGKYRVDEDGPIPLSDTQLAYRSGYLDARKDSARCYKYNQKKTR